MFTFLVKLFRRLTVICAFVIVVGSCISNIVKFYYAGIYEDLLLPIIAVAMVFLIAGTFLNCIIEGW